jgi:hypothetical protein
MNDKVLLLELKERLSGNGNRYLSGWLGKASVVAFLDRDAAEPTWQVYVSTPKPRPEQRDNNQGRPSPSRSDTWRQDTPSRVAMGGRRTMQPGELNDRLDDVGSHRG